jgi:DNA invertase Pin-like site-specific DNA recombinase
MPHWQTHGQVMGETVSKRGGGQQGKTLRTWPGYPSKLATLWLKSQWGRSVVDLVNTLHELHALGVEFISLHEALDFTTPTGRAMAGLLAIFAQFEREILRERVKAGIAQARRHGKPHGRPPSVAHRVPDVQQLAAAGLSQSAIARQLGISRTSVRRFIRTALVAIPEDARGRKEPVTD